MHLFAIDIGSKLTKYGLASADAAAPSSLRSVVAAAESANTISGMTCSFAGRTFLLGRPAERCLPPEHRSNLLTEQGLYGEDWLALFYGGLGDALRNAGIAPQTDPLQLAVATGLPQSWYAGHKERLAGKLYGRHHFACRHPRHPAVVWTIDIVSVHVLPQAVGAALGPDTPSNRVGCIDIGHHFSNFALLECQGDLSWAPQAAKTVELGVATLYDELTTRIRQACGLQVNEELLPKVVQHPHVLAGAGTLDLRTLIDETIRQQAERLLAALPAWPAGALRLTGGGAQTALFGGYLQQRLSGVQIPPQPEYAVWSGYRLALCARES